MAERGYNPRYKYGDTDLKIIGKMRDDTTKVYVAAELSKCCRLF